MSRTHERTPLLISLLLTIALNAQQLSPPAAAQPHIEAPDAHLYTLGPGDALRIQALHADEISRIPYQVDERGECNLPMVGAIRAAGLTVGAFEAAIRERLREHINEPQVTVVVTEFRSRPVTVLGAVKTPGTQYLRGRAKLLDVIAAAGGLEKDAAGTVVLKRARENGPIPVSNCVLDATGKLYVAEVPLRKLLEGESAPDIEVEGRDELLVPRIELVSVLGEVGRPGTVPLGDSGFLSVLEALAQSGGLKSTAAASKARILRPLLGGPRRAELPVDLARILKGQARDVPLLPNDILVVPNSRGRVVMTRAMELLIGPATTLGTAIAITR